MSLKRILVLLAFIPYFVQGQGFGLGLNPSNISWNQINTDKVQVIFPVGLEDRAQRAANLIHMLDDSSYYQLDVLREKVSIILQNQTTISNGFVTVSPFRSEFFTTPPQFGFGGAVDWMDFLTIHEYRHVQQYSNARRGITKLGSYLFGQNGWGGFAVVAMPRWFFEGDATFYETALTNAGRGRTPDFDRLYRALMLDNRHYNYEKASAFSFKDFVPNHYNLGYYMTTHIRNKYGQEALNQAAIDAVNYKGIFYPLNRGFKSSTGLGTKALYRETFQTLADEWQNEAEQLDLTPSRQINEQEKIAFTSYKQPVFIDNETIIAEKSGFREIRTFVKIDRRTGAESVVTRPGLYSPDNAVLSSYGDRWLFWAERTVDERWGNQNFSVITRYDMERGKKQKLTKRSKYFAPEVSPDGKQIVTSLVPETTQYGLHILQSGTGELVTAIDNPENYFFSFPRWVDNERVIVVVQHRGLQGLAIINIHNESYDWLIDLQQHQLSYPRVHGNHAFFNSTRTGIDNIHAVNLSTKEESQVTSTLLGGVQPVISPDGSTLVYSEFTAMGWNLMEMELDPNQWRPIKERYPTEIDFYQPAVSQGNILENVPKEEFPVGKFNKSEGLFQLHSWSAIALHPNYGGIVFMGNKLSTLSASANYQYNVNEDEGSWGVSGNFAEWYPVLRVDYDHANRSRNTLVYYEDISPSDTIFQFAATSEWVEDDIGVGVILPFNLTSGNHFGNLEVETMYSQIFMKDYEYLLGLPGETRAFSRIDQSFGAAEINVEFNRFQTAAVRQVLPRWAQLVDLSYRRTIGTEKYASTYFHAIGRFIFPGIVKTHGFSIRPGIKLEDLTDNYKFRDNFFYARGYDASFADNVWRIGADYTFPLWLPDIAIGPFLFLKRIKLSPFYDFDRSILKSRNIDELEPLANPSVEGSLNEIITNRASTGAELRFEFRFLRLVDADIGVRYNYLIDEPNPSDQHTFSFVLGGITF